MLAATLLAAGCAGGDSNEARTTAPPADTAAAPNPLGAIVIAEDDPPAGTEFVRATEGPTVADILVQSAEVRPRVKEGLVAALVREFLSPDLAAAVEEEAEEGARGEVEAAIVSPGRLAIASWAAAYEDEESAAAALEEYMSELRERPGLELVSETQLGDDRGGLFGGDDAGIPTRVYVWRQGSLVLHLDADGSVAVDADAIDALARGMQERAAG
jgi:hypothetical protein